LSWSEKALEKQNNNIMSKSLSIDSNPVLIYEKAINQSVDLHKPN
jgi:hypothetical protein